jgi:hypothetical protein
VLLVLVPEQRSSNIEMVDESKTPQDLTSIVFRVTVKPHEDSPFSKIDSFVLKIQIFGRNKEQKALE